MKDVLGKAMHDFYFNQPSAKLWIHNRYGEKEDMPVKLYFRDKKNMPQLEQLALGLCRGKVLDIGAGAGSHALALQQLGVDVTAIDTSEAAVKVMKHRGVKNVMVNDVFLYRATGFDTLLMMMNGIGFTGSTQRLRVFLQQAKTLLNNNGQLLFDSSDVAYLYDYKLPLQERYYGEIDYCYEYKKEKTEWFSWLYIDRQTLAAVAEEEGWQMKILGEDTFHQYLVRLTLK